PRPPPPSALHSFPTRRSSDLSGRPFLGSWSPAGSVLRFSVWDDSYESSALWEASINGTHLRPLLPGWSNPPSEWCGNWTPDGRRSEEHTSELQSRVDLVCRLL